VETGEAGWVSVVINRFRDNYGAVKAPINYPQSINHNTNATIPTEYRKKTNSKKYYKCQT
jgi:hypothetical protein